MPQEAPVNRKQVQSRATQKRLLDAALEEFGQFGLAGARVDRIAERAAANKRSIYVYFGTKEELFDIVVAQELATLITAVDFNAEDFPASALRMYDYLTAHPNALRLFAWRNLERSVRTLTGNTAYQDWIAQTRDAQEAGRLNADMPADLLIRFSGAIVQAWGIAADPLRDSRTSQEVARESVRLAVGRLTAVQPAVVGAGDLPGNAG